MTREIVADKIINFVEEKKKEHINYNHLTSGSSTIVYPISTTLHDDKSKATIEIQTNGDKRHWSRFEQVLKRKFPHVKMAYYCQSDGSCPSVYRIKIDLN